GLLIFSGQAGAGELVPSEEGDLAWIPLGDVDKFPLLDDVPILLDRIRATGPGEAPFSARSFLDAKGRLQVIFDE
ncbi:MAG: hypothetical protein CVU24_09185, partial [Betaproteobacteria bacterium HGW-Betaproteobacteria-18]